MTRPEELNNLVEFDSPFVVDDAGNVTDATGIYAPEVTQDLDADGQAIGDPDISACDWSFVDGYSSQDRYSGPVMHPSEFLGGRMARDVLAEPGTYVICAVESIDDDDLGSDPIGWVLLRREPPTDQKEPAML